MPDGTTRRVAGRAGRELEVLVREPSHPRGLPPLLLVHGAWHGAWCWDRGFMERLAARGHLVEAVSLRGHGGSWGRGPLARRAHGLAGYVADVAAAADSMPEPPVVVGHSMGGLVVARHLSGGGRGAAGVLMAPLPTSGVAGLTLRLARRDPLALARVFATLSCRPVVGDAARARALLFGPRTGAAEAEAAFRMLGDESFRAFLDLLAPRVRPARARVPVAVLAAGADAVFTPAEEEATAAAFGGRPVTFPGMGHDMMLEPGWEAVADLVSELASGARAAAAPSDAGRRGPARAA